MTTEKQTAPAKVIQRPDVVLVLTNYDYHLIKLALKHYKNSQTMVLLRKLIRQEKHL